MIYTLRDFIHSKHWRLKDSQLFRLRFLKASLLLRIKILSSTVLNLFRMSYLQGNRINETDSHIKGVKTTKVIRHYTTRVTRGSKMNQTNTAFCHLSCNTSRSSIYLHASLQPRVNVVECVNNLVQVWLALIFSSGGGGDLASLTCILLVNIDIVQVTLIVRDLALLSCSGSFIDGILLIKSWRVKYREMKVKMAVCVKGSNDEWEMNTDGEDIQ